MEEGDAAFWAGYRDCGEQAIHFLLQSGTASEEDPLIQGLRLHLREKALDLQPAQTGTEHSQHPQSGSHHILSQGPQVTTALLQNTDNLHNRSHHQMDLEHSMDEGYDSSINTSISDTSDLSIDLTTSHTSGSLDLSLDLSSPSSTSVNVKDVFSSASNTPQIQQRAHTVTVDTFTPIMHHQVTCPVTCTNPPISCGTFPPIFSTPVSSSRMIHPEADVMALPQDLRGVDPFRDPVGLAMLAQNNPQIASVAQELLELLSENCEDDLLEDSDGEDMYEDGDVLEEDVMESVVDEDIENRGQCEENICNNNNGIIHEQSSIGDMEDNGNMPIIKSNLSEEKTEVLYFGDNKENCDSHQRNLSSPSKLCVSNSSPRQLSPLQVKSNN